MKDIDQMTDEELIKEMRKEGKKQGTMEYFIYSLLSTAHPNAIAMIEQQAAQMKRVGHAIGKEMKEAENDPQKKAQILSTLENAGTIVNPSDDEEVPTI